MSDENNNVGSAEPYGNVHATVAVVLVTLFVYFVHFLWAKKSVREVRADRTLLLRSVKPANGSMHSIGEKGSSEYTACTSPECVRCLRYQIVRAEAQDKLSQFVRMNGDSGLDRISASLLDLKSLPAEPLQKPNVLYVPGLRSRPFWSSSEGFAHETNLLERQWGFIAGEFESVCHESSSNWNQNTTETGTWSVFYLYNQGQRIEKNCRKCPRTAALVESFSSFMKLNVFGNAFFSVLDPGTVVSEHCGPCNIRIRCHLGLSIPSKTSVTVGGETRPYNLGCCIYFDDSFIHSSVNCDSDGPRSVLLLDFWHPDLTMKERDALGCIFPAQSTL